MFNILFIITVKLGSFYADSFQYLDCYFKK